MNTLERFKRVALLQEHYEQFVDFLADTLEFLGFSMTELQADIGNFLQYSSGDIGVQAQRSQAKSTITAAYAVWSLIQDPTERVLILSAGDTQATEISTLIVKLITNWDVLACLKPDRNAGDRTSVEAFDIHYSLKGIDKSPSVACAGVTANLQGKRAGLLIADDVESQKNSRSAIQREVIVQAIKDFSSIVQSGRIVFLGTPQSKESIYNDLPSRGVNMRIWTGRYPTKEQLPSYGRLLAPYILRKLKQDPSLGTGGGRDGSQGKPTDPQLLDEAQLQHKENMQGTTFFQLQHMLNTSLADSLKYPLKSDQLIVMRFTDNVPLEIKRGMTAGQQQLFDVGGIRLSPMWPHSISNETAKLTGGVFYIDPAGGGKNADETGYAHVCYSNAKLFVKRVGGVSGGYSLPQLQKLAKTIVEAKPETVIIEKNFGYGAFKEVFLPILRSAPYNYTGKIDEDYVTGQKERRIVDTLEPVIGRGSLIIHESVFREDWESTQDYSLESRKFYTFAYQFTAMTLQAGSCVHDDRIDALAGAVGYYVKALQLDQAKSVEKLKDEAILAFNKDPLGHNRYKADVKASGHNARSRALRIRR